MNAKTIKNVSYTDVDDYTKHKKEEKTRII